MPKTVPSALHCVWQWMLYSAVSARLAVESVGAVADIAHWCVVIAVASWEDWHWWWLAACSCRVCKPVLHSQFSSRHWWSALAIHWFKSIWPCVGWWAGDELNRPFLASWISIIWNVNRIWCCIAIIMNRNNTAKCYSSCSLCAAKFKLL